MSSIFGSGNFRQVGGQAGFRPYKNWHEGDQLAGKLVEIRQDKFGKPAYVVEVQEVAFSNTSEQPQVGSLFTLNSSGGLQHKIDKIGGVSIGDVIGVEYQGTAQIESGKWKGKETHSIEFYISAGNAPTPPATDSL